MYHQYIIIFLISYTLTDDSVRITDKVSDAYHCYQSITDDSYQIAFDFNLIFSQPPSILFMSLQYSLLSLINEKLDNKNHIHFATTLKLVNHRCRYTLTINDDETPNKMIIINIILSLRDGSDPFTNFKFISNANSASYVTTVYDNYNIVEIYVSVRRNHRGKIKIPSTHNIEPISTYYDLNHYNRECICGVNENRKFLFRPISNNNPYNFNRAYNEIKISLQSAAASNTYTEIVSKKISIWPCDCTISKLLLDPIIAIPDIPLSLRVVIYVNFASGNDLEYTTNIDRTEFTTSAGNTINFRNIAIERYIDAVLRKNDKDKIYLLETNEVTTHCESGSPIVVKTNYNSNTLDIKVKNKFTYKDGSLTRYVSYLCFNEDPCI